ncbi:hypothetical protein ACH4TE_19780 [Streptomyces sioyaensis]|uniref:hypothetical protein n=1 Tax=Streptomyces sioyaensis TaxID=67364 RepID=UPI0037963003
MSTVRKYRIFIAALDFVAALAVLGTLTTMSLVAYRGGEGVFPGGNDGRVVFAALTAAVIAYGVQSTLDSLAGPTRDSWVDAIREQLTQDAQRAVRQYVRAARQWPEDPALTALRDASLRSQASALKFGADPADF